jgi:putative endonuclease
MYSVYIIRSQNRNYTYVGISDNVERRLNQHNLGYNKTTKPYSPFKLICVENLPNRQEARKREKYYKDWEGRNKIKEIIAGVAEW